MKSIVSNTPCNKETPFPKLMISNTSNIICLCSSATNGVCVGNPDLNNPIGKVYDGLSPFYWDDFNGSICLQNKD